MEIKEKITVGVVISTYNNPEWLEKTLWGYESQTFNDFEIIIADDGSGASTEQLIKWFQTNSSLKIKHVWHPDNGFEKCKILNKAIKESCADYLIFTDQDCIPRNDFIETHLRYAREGYILSGGYFRLPMSISKNITKEDIYSQCVFILKELKMRGLEHNWKNTKLYRLSAFSAFMNFITPTKATWNGCNASAWRKDIIAVNGFNEDMQYGGEDREFGERLSNMGIKSKQIRYSAICLHLDHARPYKKPEIIAQNNKIRKETIKNKIIRTPRGIN